MIKNYMLLAILTLVLPCCYTTENVMVPVEKTKQVPNEVTVKKVQYYRTQSKFWNNDSQMNLAILPFTSSNLLSSDIAEYLYTNITLSEEVLTKYLVFSLKSLNDQKEIMGLISLDPESAEVKEKLRIDLGINLILYGSDFSNQKEKNFNLKLFDLDNGMLLGDNEFKNSFNSNPIQDVILYLTNGMEPNYYSETIVDGIKEERYQDYEKREVEKLDVMKTIGSFWWLPVIIYGLLK